MWSAREWKTGFSISWFWSICKAPKEMREKKRREKRKGEQEVSTLPAPTSIVGNPQCNSLPNWSTLPWPIFCPLATGEPQAQDGSGWRCVLVAVEVSKGKAGRREWMYPIDEVEEEEECWMCG